MEIQEHIPLAPLTTLRVGGAARFFARIDSVEDLREALIFAKAKSLPFLVLGAGSNMLIGREGFPGLVLHITFPGLTFREEGDHTILTAGAGEVWDPLVAHAVERGLWGIENLSGIPGTAGAAPVQNIGAYGMELNDTLQSVDVFDTAVEEVRTLTNAECNFGYRTSRFKKEPGRYIILQLSLTLSSHGMPNLSYKDVAEAFAGNPSPSLKNIRMAVRSIREKKFPDLEKEGTAGSFFLNPVVSSEKAREISVLLPGLPQFPTEGGVKLSLAYLLDKGLGLRGLSVGGARLFERQPLVIVTSRTATPEDVVALARSVAEKVKEAYGIVLEPEVRIL